MLIPEEQAKRTMWCPMVRVRWPNKVVAGNRVNPGHKDRLTNAIFLNLLSSVCTGSSG